MKALMQWLRLHIIAGFLSWASSHPIQTILFTFLFTIIPLLIACCNDDPLILIPGLILFGMGIGAWSLSVWEHTMQNKAPRVGPKLMVLLLTGLFSYNSVPGAEPSLPPPPSATPELDSGALVGVGVVVICVGGYCIYKMVKVCQKKFPPKDTNAPSELTLTVSSTDEYGGAYEYSSIGSCYIPVSANSNPYEDLLHNPTTFTLNVRLQNGTVMTSMTVNNQEGTTQTWDQFAAEMAEHGLMLTGHASSQAQYEYGGAPCDLAMVPLEFDLQTGRVIQKKDGYALRRVIVQRSPNMQDWYPLLATDVADGTGFKVIDTTREGQMFYRTQVIQP